MPHAVRPPARPLVRSISSIRVPKNGRCIPGSGYLFPAKDKWPSGSSLERNGRTWWRRAGKKSKERQGQQGEKERERKREREAGRSNDEWKKRKVLLGIGRKNDGNRGEQSVIDWRTQGNRIGWKPGPVVRERRRMKPLKVPAARWWCSHRPLLTGREGARRGGAGGWRTATVVLAEAGHRAILSAIETGTC